MITVLVAEGYRFLRDLYEQLLSADPNVRCIGSTGTGREALRLARELVPDVLILDISLPDANGLEITRALKATCPTIRVVVLGDEDSEEYRAAATASGASAYMHKKGMIEQLVPLIRSLGTAARKRNSHGP